MYTALSIFVAPKYNEKGKFPSSSKIWTTGRQLKYKYGDWTYIHTCRSYVHTPREVHARRRVTNRNIRRYSAGRFVRFWASGGAKFPKMGDSLTWTRMNGRAKFDAAIALSSAEKSVTVQTNKQTNKHTNSKRYIHTLPIGTCVWITVSLVLGIECYSRKVNNDELHGRAYDDPAFPWLSGISAVNSDAFNAEVSQNPPITTTVTTTQLTWKERRHV